MYFNILYRVKLLFYYCSNIKSFYLSNSPNESIVHVKCFTSLFSIDVLSKKLANQGHLIADRNLKTIHVKKLVSLLCLVKSFLKHTNQVYYYSNHYKH